MHGSKAISAARVNLGAAGSGDWRSTLARSGLIAKGVLYGSLGLLALRVAEGRASTRSVSKEGAVELVASQPLGHWLLVLFTIGLFALAAWQAIVTFTGDPVEGDAPMDRATFATKAVIYATTAVYALGLLMARSGVGSGPSRRNEGSEDRAASMLMDWPGGTWLVALIGCGLMALAIYHLYEHAYLKRFMRRLAVAGGELTATIENAGRAGYAARAIVLLVVGAFFLTAAIQHDPREAVGLSGALAALARQTWGPFLLWFVAIGLLLYGCFCFAEARYRRAT